MDDPLLQIARLAINEFVNTLRHNRDYNWSGAHGKPPTQAYIEQKDYATTPWSNTPSLAAWSVVDYETVNAITPRTEWKKPVIDGMFFDCMIGYWGVTKDCKYISINWQTGPRFGRGFAHAILQAETGILYLGSPRSTWVS